MLLRAMAGEAWKTECHLISCQLGRVAFAWCYTQCEQTAPCQCEQDLWLYSKTMIKALLIVISGSSKPDNFTIQNSNIVEADLEIDEVYVYMCLQGGILPCYPWDS